MYYMKCFRKTESPSPRPVATAYPKIPLNNAGRTKSFHLFEDAIAAAVVGPPTFAFDAKTISLNGIFRHLPTLTAKEKCNIICVQECTNNTGAVFTTVGIWPIA